MLGKFIWDMDILCVCAKICCIFPSFYDTMILKVCMGPKKCVCDTNFSDCYRKSMRVIFIFVTMISKVCMRHKNVSVTIIFVLATEKVCLTTEKVCLATEKVCLATEKVCLWFLFLSQRFFFGELSHGPCDVTMTTTFEFPDQYKWSIISYKVSSLPRIQVKYHL